MKLGILAMIGISIMMIPQLAIAEQDYYITPKLTSYEEDRPCIFHINTYPCIPPEKIIYYVSLYRGSTEIMTTTTTIFGYVVGALDLGDSTKLYLNDGKTYNVTKLGNPKILVGNNVKLVETITKPECLVKEMAFFNGTEYTSVLDGKQYQRVEQEVLDSIYKDPAKYGYTTSFDAYPQFNEYVEDYECQSTYTMKAKIIG